MPKLWHKSNSLLVINTLKEYVTLPPNHAVYEVNLIYIKFPIETAYLDMVGTHSPPMLEILWQINACNFMTNFSRRKWYIMAEDTS